MDLTNTAINVSFDLYSFSNYIYCHLFQNGGQVLDRTILIEQLIKIMDQKISHIIHITFTQPNPILINKYVLTNVLFSANLIRFSCLLFIRLQI